MKKPRNSAIYSIPWLPEKKLRKRTELLVTKLVDYVFIYLGNERA